MSSAGSIQAMITAMKNNARRRKVSDKSLAGTKKGALYSQDQSKTPKHTPEQIAAAKAAFQIKVKQEKKRRKKVFLVTILAAAIICYLIYLALDCLKS